MDCRATASWLREAEVPAWGEPPQEVAAHLAACEDCAALLARQRRVAALLATAPVPAPAADLWAPIRRALERPRGLRLHRWLPAAAALGVAALLLFGRSPAAPPVMVTAAELRPNSYVQQHLMTIGTDQLSDPTAMQAVGVLALRAERSHGRREL